MANRFLITFAGAIGSSKTPIAYYLSWKLNLPIFSNDSIRSEVIEDIGTLNIKEYQKRRDKRLKEIVKNGLPFIYDASVDREWNNLKDKVKPFGYKIFIISLDLSKKFLISLCKKKGYKETLKRMDNLIAEHKLFLLNYKHKVKLHISDKNFNNRLELSYRKIRSWLK